MNLISYLKREKVMTISLILAVLSAIAVHPDKEYMGYIDVRVLGLLFCLMAAVKGFQKIGVFDAAAQVLFTRVKGSRALMQILVGLCFFSSMLITNDVALITFVPFAVLVLQKCDLTKYMIFTVVMQTIAANLGSMFTPIGNPQNLYLFGISDLGMGEFLKITAPITGLSLLALFAVTFCIPNVPVIIPVEKRIDEEAEKNSKVELPAYLLLFLIDLIVVFRVIPWWIAFAVTVGLLVLIRKQELLKQVDYALLITFVGFFIFVGNIGRIPMINEAIGQLITGREIVVSALFSQVMSNVPAALLLAGFTDNIKALIIGTNIGGLGTLIASMASLISYKIYAQTPGAQKGKYLAVFSLYNVVGLIVLLLVFH